MNYILSKEKPQIFDWILYNEQIYKIKHISESQNVIVLISCNQQQLLQLRLTYEHYENLTKIEEPIFNIGDIIVYKGTYLYSPNGTDINESESPIFATVLDDEADSIYKYKLKICDSDTVFYSTSFELEQIKL